MEKTTIKKKLEAILTKAQQTKARLKSLEPEIKELEADITHFVSETAKPRPKVLK